jgi:hypothetical protein
LTPLHHPVAPEAATVSSSPLVAASSAGTVAVVHPTVANSRAAEIPTANFFLVARVLMNLPFKSEEPDWPSVVVSVVDIRQDVNPIHNMNGKM